MRKRLPIAQAVFATGLLFFSAVAFAWPASVDHVADGDTVTVVNEQTGQKVRVRLAGLDAPEVAHRRGEPSQPYGQASRKLLIRLLRGGAVAVHPNGTHSYDRIVATITVNGRDVGRQLVAAGMAWDYRRYAPSYASAQREAKRNQRGLWQQNKPTPPWIWRHRR